jgi:hypothetical protein
MKVQDTYFFLSTFYLSHYLVEIPHPSLVTSAHKLNDQKETKYQLSV